MPSPAAGSEATPVFAPCESTTGLNVAIAQAAHDTLVALWPAQTATLDSLARGRPRRIRRRRREDREASPSAQRAAAAILARRVNDGSDHRRAGGRRRLHPGYGTGRMATGPDQPDPARSRREVGRGEAVRAAVRRASSGLPPPPALTSDEVHERVQRGEAPGRRRPHHAHERTADQTIAGIYWGYDGTPHLSAPPRLYNQIAVHIANQRGTARATSSTGPALGPGATPRWPTPASPAGNRSTSTSSGGPSAASAKATPTATRTRSADPDFSPLGAPASNIVPGRELHAAVPRLRVRARHLREPRCSRPCAGSMGRTTSPSPSCPTSSTA